MHTAPPVRSPSSIIRTDWDNLPLGENLSHLCGGTNKHPLGGLQYTNEQDMARGDTIAEQKKYREGRSAWRLTDTAQEMLENLG